MTFLEQALHADCRRNACLLWAIYSSNHGSSKICLADALADGSNRNNLPIICPSFAMSSLVRSGLCGVSKYNSSSYACKSGAGSSMSASSCAFIFCHVSCHLSGRSSLAISRIWPTRIVGVIKKVSKGGWPTKSSKSYYTYQLLYYHMAFRAEYLTHHTSHAP